jgi:Transposase DDE domain
MRQREAPLRDEIARRVRRAETQDAAEDQEDGADSDGSSVNEELALRERRLAKIRALRERLEAEQRAEQALAEDQPPVIDDKEPRSFADGEARIMLRKRGDYASASNTQAAVDAASGSSVGADLTNTAPDGGHQPELVRQIRGLRARANLPAAEATTVSADAGSFSTDNIAEDGDGIDLLIAAGRDDPATAAVPKRGVGPADVFGFDVARDVWVCPAGKVLARQVTPPGAAGRPAKDRYRADLADCALCPQRPRCLQPGQDRRVLVTQRRRPTGALRYKRRQPANRRRYARRNVIVEPVFGQLTEDRGFTTRSLRGLLLAKAEYRLACLAHNLGNLLRAWPLGAAHRAPAARA